MPDHTYAIDEKPRFVQYYDLLKSEYIAARVLYFEALTIQSEPFTDRHVLHFDSFDSTLFGLRAEKLKACYRIAYSLFDKMALFINDYFRINRTVQDVSFRKIFYEKTPRGAPPTLASVFSGHRNWPLRGLYALSKDIFDPEFKETAASDAQILADLRHAAEHRFLSLHEYLTEEQSGGAHFKVTASLFEEKTLRTIKLARAALIYLSLAVRQEERLREKDKSESADKLHANVVGVPLRKT